MKWVRIALLIILFSYGAFMIYMFSKTNSPSNNTLNGTPVLNK